MKVFVFVFGNYACVCVCVRERQREREIETVIEKESRRDIHEKRKNMCRVGE